MNTKEKALKTVNTISSFIQDNPDFISRATATWNENKQLSKQIQILKMQNDKEILKITKRYELFRDILTAVFSERQTALSAHYKTLDNAIASNDREMIIASLQGISSIVTQNPLESFTEFSKVLDDENETLTLDF